MDNVGLGELEIYLRSYWDYYLALEGRYFRPSASARSPNATRALIPSST